MPTLTPQLILNALAGAMLVLAFFLVARMRLRSLLVMFSWQSSLLVAFASVIAISEHEPHLFITAILTLVLKTILFPWLILMTADRAAASHRMHSYLRPATSLLATAVIVVIGFALTRSFIPLTNADYFIGASSVSMLLIGLFMLVARKGMYGQIVGFLLMENGIFIFGLFLTGGMPLLVELGIFFDVTIGAVLMAALSYRVQKETKTVTTDTLRELVD